MNAAAAETGPVRLPLPSAAEIAALPPDGGPEFNRLIFSQSPYLLQHARNPVDWHPWGEEAFAKARAENKPVFLSIGYATCHWCHVMEHESFEDEEVAAAINARFVPVKVDREERPDIDEVYMTVTQALTGGGGWPMTVLLTPDKQPFFAGTYFPKRDAPGRSGLLTILELFHKLWTEQREKVVAEGGRVAAFLRGRSEAAPGELPGRAARDAAFDHFLRVFDPENAGFGGAPKFPVPTNLSFLARHHARTGDARAMDMLDRTLVAMRRGGIFDQIGFGLHRYSTDRVWLVPHFEKMLYDQALLVLAAADAYQAGGNPFHAETAREILTYVLRDLTGPEGGFFSAEDADSEGKEGTFYLWTPDQIVDVLGPEEGGWFNRTHGIVPEGNFLEEATRTRTGENIPHLKAPWEGPDEVRRAAAAREKLFARREGRPRPFKDDKILTDWNGLMIAALARAAQALNTEEYRAAATKAADFALGTLRRPDGKLVKRYRAGEAGLAAHLEDYAFLVWGLIELYEATFELRFLRAAVDLTETMETHFRDPAGGGYFMTADDGEPLLVRLKKVYGGAMPSGNEVAALNLARLYRLTGQEVYARRLEDLFRAFGSTVRDAPHAFPVLLQALDFVDGPAREIVLAGNPEDPVLQDMARAVRSRFLPAKVLLHRPPGDVPDLAVLAPFAAAQIPVNGKATAYVCEGFACRLPVHDVAALEALLDGAPAKP
jgi:uncharacterized protein YyaL (SSP411 family)